MTEAEWLASSEPQALLDALCTWDTADPRWTREQWRPPSDRKLRLFACAVTRLAVSLSPNPHCRITLEDVATAERFADGLASKDDLAQASIASDLWCCNPGAVDAAIAVVHSIGSKQSEIACLLREVVGNPFRPQPLQWIHGRPSPWSDPDVLALAQTAYHERDWSALLPLSDALEGAGCVDEVLLRHLRGEELAPMAHMPKLAWWRPLRGPHVRGCWVIDAILGKE